MQLEEKGSPIVAAGRKLQDSLHKRQPHQVNHKSDEDLAFPEISFRARTMDLVPGTTASSAPEQTLAVNCEICGDLTRMDEVIPVRDVDGAAEDGCQTCALLCNVVSAFPLREDSCKELKLWYNYREGATLLDLSNDGGLSEILELFAYEGAPSIWPTIKPAREICGDSSSDDCFGLVQKWLQDCVQSHSKCKQIGAFIPTRLIYVGTGSEDMHLRTDFSPAEEEQSATYAALSYCWGPPESISAVMKTTQSNISQRLRTIPLETLPKTIQDAIIITRRLGITFLWVDALCIIQDSEADWANEAFKMSDVYQNAIVTIAAEGASSSQEGCFLAGKSRPTSALVYRGDSTKQQGNVYARETLPTVTRPQRCFYHDNWPLMTRAWTLQERLLSSRILHYTPSEVIWSCMTHTCCECTLCPQPTDPSVLIKTWLHSNQISPEGQFGKGSIERRWLDMVEDYTARDVTNPSDRLAAISGLAAYTQRYLEDTYLAGLWKCSLAEGLLWYVWTRKPVSRRHQEYLAPTWSWASVTGRVNFCYDRTASSHCLRIVDASCRVVGQNPYGAAADGQLTVTGLLSPARLRKKKGTIAELELVEPFHGESYYPIVYPDVEDVIDLDEPYFLLLAQELEQKAYYLLLRKAVSGPWGHEYERLGIVWADMRLVPAIDARETTIVIV